jgi:molybdopterin converting factor small subunit
MRITVQFVSLFRTLAGVEQEVLEVARGTTIDILTGILVQKHPELPLKDESTYFAVNEQVSPRDRVLGEGDRVRIFRLLAGG